MDDRTKYILALGAFRRSVHDLMGAAAALHSAAHLLDPNNQLPDDPVADALFLESLEELRGAAVLLPGIRQLFQAVVE